MDALEPSIPGIRVVAVRSPTLPPATHTNTWVVGDGALTVIDPASPWEDEQQRLAEALEARIARGEHVERIFLTHHHVDHVSGAAALQARLSTPARRVPIVAHALTAPLVDLVVDELVAHGDALEAGGRTLVAHHTPGHAPGHVALHDLDSGTIVAGDMVAGIGTILVDFSDGDLGRYLASLEALRALTPHVLLPAHGPALYQPEVILSFYAAHRHARTDQIRRALDAAGRASALQLAQAVYGAEVPPHIVPLAARQVVSHLRWLAEHGLATPIGEPDSRWVDQAWERA